MKTYSLDLRQRIVDCYDQGKHTQIQVAKRFSVSLGFVKKLLQQRSKTGDISSRYHRVGRKSIISENDQQSISHLVEQRPDITLEEIKENLALQCHITTIHYFLKKMNYSYKKKL